MHSIRLVPSLLVTLIAAGSVSAQIDWDPLLQQAQLENHSEVSPAVSTQPDGDPMLQQAQLENHPRVSPSVSAQPYWAPLQGEPLEKPLRLVRNASSISWPVSGRQIPIRVGSRMAVRDEMPIRYITLAAADLVIQLPFESTEYWVPLARPTGRHGYELTFKYNVKIRMGVTAVRRTSFLRSLDGRYWNAYLASLGGRPNSQLITNADSNLNANMLKALDGRTRVLEYRHDAIKKDDPQRAVLQVFTEIRDGPLLIFTLECTPDEMPGIGSAFEEFVTSFEYPVEE